MSTLHLARREIQDCLSGTVIDEEHVVDAALREPHRLFATAMVIMAAIDLLAKFYTGSDETGKAGARIKAFTARFIFDGHPSAERFAEVLYLGLRNPLLHSFTLYNDTLKINVSASSSAASIALTSASTCASATARASST